MVVPVCDFIRKETLESLKTLSENGAEIVFLKEEREAGAAACACYDGTAKTGGGTKIAVGENCGVYTADFGESITVSGLLKKIRRKEKKRALLVPKKNVIRQSYEGGITAYYNNNLQETELVAAKNVTIYNPATGGIYGAKAGDTVKIGAYRLVFAEAEE